MLRVGLNPYGITYYLGLQGRGTPRANPNGRGLNGFLEIAEELGARTIEFHNGWFAGPGEAELRAFRERIERNGMTPVVSLGPPLEGVDTGIAAACAIGARIVRLGLSPVLSGDRAAQGERWPGMVAHARRTLREFAPGAAEHGLAFAIEDHQDFGSEELLGFCAEAGPNVGICLDTGNPLAVGEEPAAFARKVALMVRHVHLKDYRAQWTEEGYRLVRCAIGDGCVSFREIAAILEEHHESLTASLEPGALEARHIRLFRESWWEGYPERSARELAPALAAARVRRLEEDADWRTPWEAGAGPGTIIRYELEMIRRSMDNMRALGLVP